MACTIVCFMTETESLSLTPGETPGCFTGHPAANRFTHSKWELYLQFVSNNNAFTLNKREHLLPYSQWLRPSWYQHIPGPRQLLSSWKTLKRCKWWNVPSNGKCIISGKQYEYEIVKTWTPKIWKPQKHNERENCKTNVETLKRW